jgi:tetratricopeptide (TPR) repeat protein
VIARLRYSGAGLDVAAAELAAAAGRIDALDGGEPGSRVRTVFSWSLGALDAPAASMFRLLGLHPGGEVRLAAASSLAGLAPQRTARLLTELTRASLISDRGDGRFVPHDLLHLYAAELARRDEPAGLRDGAQRRLLDHYLHTAHLAEQRLAPARDPICLPLLPAAPGTVVEPIGTAEEALTWFSRHDQALLGAVRQAAADGLARHTWQLTWCLFTYLSRQGRWNDLVALQELAVAAAGDLDHPLVAPQAEHDLAYARRLVGRVDDARRGYAAALAGFEAAGHDPGRAQTHHSLSILHEGRGEPGIALTHSRRALELYRVLGHRAGQARSLNVLGWCQVLLGDLPAAEASCRSALALFTELGDRHGLAYTWDSLGYLEHQAGRPAEAVAAYRSALDSFPRHGADRHAVAEILDHLAGSYAALGRHDEAATAKQDSADILDGIDLRGL